jgi:hypothetical protein
MALGFEPDPNDKNNPFTQISDLWSEVDRLTKALKPFADVGQQFIAPCASGAFPPGASARAMKLEPLVAQDFVNAALAFRKGR